MKRPLLLLTVFWSVACQPERRCDEGYVFDTGQCLRAQPDAGGSNDTMAADVGITFGTACKDGVNHSDCQSETTSVCLIPPGATEGQCSQIGCDTNPAVCPTGWNCFDLSIFQPGAPFGCVPF